MLRASRPTETHARGAQARPTEPAGAGVAAGPTTGPPPQPETHDAASATPSATTPIRLATTNIPRSPRSLAELRSQSPLRRAGSLVPPGIHRAVSEEWSRL